MYIWSDGLPGSTFATLIPGHQFSFFPTNSSGKNEKTKKRKNEKTKTKGPSPSLASRSPQVINLYLL